MKTAMLIDCAGVLDAGGSPVLTRMRLADVPVLLFADDAIALDDDAIVAQVAPCAFPRPRQLLLACREHAVDMASSWLITARGEGLEAASQAGIPQAVFIGASLPLELPPIRVELARDLADAPRVMVPKEGGCWHDHR